jgi:hypothetical protein
LAASISVEAVTPPLVGLALVKIHFQSRFHPEGSQFVRCPQPTNGSRHPAVPSVVRLKFY